MSKDEMIKIIDQTQEPGTSSIVVYTKDYIYCLLSKDTSTWTEAVFEFPESFSKKEIPAEKALLLLIEELTKGLPGYFSELPVVKDPGEINKIKDMINKGSA
ncbi:MAG: hypothetical protein ACTSO9_08790 [Candidatus Helarchaeota archaeon]